MPERPPWLRRKGEGSKAYAAFLRYRDLGPGRSVAKAVGARQAAKEGKARYFHWWRRWAGKYEWKVRSEAWDDHVAAVASDRLLDAQADAKAAENEENLRQQAARLAEARALAATARATVNTAAPVALARLVRAQAQVAELLADPLARPGALDEAIKDAIAALNWATKSMEVAHKLEALALGKATDRTAVQLDPASVDKLADVITRNVPEEKWDTVVEEVVATMKGERVNGRP